VEKAESKWKQAVAFFATIKTCHGKMRGQNFVGLIAMNINSASQPEMSFLIKVAN